MDAKFVKRIGSSIVVVFNNVEGLPETIKSMEYDKFIDLCIQILSNEFQFTTEEISVIKNGISYDTVFKEMNTVWTYADDGINGKAEIEWYLTTNLQSAA